MAGPEIDNLLCVAKYIVAQVFIQVNLAYGGVRRGNKNKSFPTLSYSKLEGYIAYLCSRTYVASYIVRYLT